MRKIIRCLLALLLLAPAAALAGVTEEDLTGQERTGTFGRPGPAPEPRPIPKADFYNTAQARDAAKRLAQQMRVDPAKISDLLYNYDHAAQDPWFRTQLRHNLIKGVFVFQAGKGGFIIGFMEGDGLASFPIGPKTAPLHLRSWSVGAQAGGQAVWGLGLIMNLRNLSHFGGDYEGQVQSATAGDATPDNWVVLRKAGAGSGYMGHEIYLLQTGRGLSAGVALERLTITPAWGP